MVKKQRFKEVFALLFSGTYLLLFLTFCLIIPAHATLGTLVPFCRKVKSVTKGGIVGIYRSADRSVLYFYLEETPPISFLSSPILARDFLHFHRNAFLIVSGRDDLASLKLKNLRIIAKKNRDDSKTLFLITLPMREISQNLQPSILADRSCTMARKLETPKASFVAFTRNKGNKS